MESTERPDIELEDVVRMFRDGSEDPAAAVENGPCTRAVGLVYGARESSYDHPRRDFERIAALWSALFDHEFQAEDVALAMIALKLSRLRGDPHHEDSAIDVAGYAECLYRVRTGR